MMSLEELLKQTVPGCKENGEISFVFTVLVSRGFPALLQGPSVLDRSCITEPLTHTAAALSQYCFRKKHRSSHLHLTASGA